MRFKPVPAAPEALEAVTPILEAVPADAGAVDDCCGHLVAETRLETREEAETWLVFLRALELVTADGDGYRLTATGPAVEDALEADRLRRAFRERVDGAAAVLEGLARADEPRSVDDVAAEYRTDRHGRFEDDATERVRRLLEWAALLDAVERVDERRYRRTASNRPLE